jgi:hypothetical protein
MLDDLYAEAKDKSKISNRCLIGQWSISLPDNGANQALKSFHQLPGISLAFLNHSSELLAKLSFTQ